MRRIASKRLVIVAILLTTATVTIGFLWQRSKSTQQITETPVNSVPVKQKLQKDPPPERIRLIAAGDFIAHDSVNSAAKLPGGKYDYLPLMSDFVPIFKQADIRFCNDPILNGGESLGITGYPNFNSPTAFVTDMGRVGCNLVSNASNHSFDFTQANIDKSVEAWEAVPNMLAVAGQNRSGAEREKVRYFTVKGVKFAFLAYTSYSNKPAQNNYGVNVFNEGFVASQVEQARKNGAQIIIASMRWGTEYSNQVNSKQTSEAQFLADQGVSLVLGHGPHVLQSVQQLKGRAGNATTVWYSLGNFINSQVPPEALFNGLAVIDFDIKLQQITSMQYLPIYMHYEWTAQQAAAETLSARRNLKLYLLDNATQSLLDAQQLRTTIEVQKKRLETTLNGQGLTIPLISSVQYNSNN